MAQVYKVMIHCPVSHNVADSGIRTSGRESLNSDIYGAGSMLCPHCAQIHSLHESGYLDLAHETLDQNLWRPNP